VTSFDDALSGLVRSAAVVFLGSVLGRLLGLVGQVLIVRSLTPVSFGHVALAYTVVSTVGGLALLGVHEGVTRLMSTTQEAAYRRSVLRSGYAFALVGGLSVAVVLYTARSWLGVYLNDGRLPGLLVLFLPYLVVYAIARVSFGALRAHRRSLAATVARDLGPRLVALLAFGLLALTGEALLGAVVYWVLAPVVMTMLAGYYLHRELSMTRVFDRLPDPETTRELWSFSWPLAVGASFFLLLSNVDVLMIGYFMDPRSVGLYRAIQPLRQVTTFVIVAFTFLFLPVATEYFDTGRLDALDRFYTVTTKWIVAGTFPPVLVFTLFAADIVRAFFGDAYVAAAPALAVLTAGLFLRAIVGLNGDMTKAIDRSRIELYAVAVAVVLNVVLNAVLVPVYGIVGAAVATVVGYAVYNVLEVAAIYRAVGSHPFSWNTLKPLVPTLLFALGVRRLAGDAELTLPILLGIGVVIAAVHLLSMFLTRSLGAADLVLFERFEERTGLDLAWLRSFLAPPE
jgi:O-antigen/teichoic acid export membrane protein